ncbi:MAG: sensor histidine kinase [Actinomycetota bacterium]
MSLWWRGGLLAAVYIATAKLGIELSVAHGVITPVWAPTGLALAVLFVFGTRLWPGVALGAFIANATSDVSIGVAAALAVGNTLEAVVGAALLRKARFDASLERVRDVLALVVFGAVASTTISATNGVTTLWLAGEIPFSAYRSEWFLWWFGDAMGDLLVAPALFVWFAHFKRRMSVRVGAEAVLVLAAIVATSLLVFIGGRWRYPYLLFPLLMWAALRFKQRGATTAIFVVGAIGVWGTVRGSVVVGGASPTESVQILQALITIVGVGLYVVAASLAEREEVERSLGVAHANLAEAQALAHIGSWEWDVFTGRVVWSDEMYRIHGFEPGAFEVSLGRALEQVPPEDRARIEMSIGNALARKSDHELAEIRYRVLRPDGSERILSGKGFAYFRDSGATRIVGTVEDITEEVAAERTVAASLTREREAVARLREIDEAKSTFISAISHDLRSPLAVIAGFAQSLKKFPRLSTEKILDIVDRIEKNALRSAKIISDLLDVDRLSRGAVAAVRSSTDVSDIVVRAIDDLAIEDREVHVDAPSGTSWVDEGLVKSIVENLLTNAVSHTPEGTPIWVRLDVDPGEVLLAVEDAGPGIPDEAKATVFDAFHRGPTEGGGSGLGLYLISQFAQLHGGRAWVEDRSGGGASFKVLLPCRPEAQADVGA